MGRRGQHMALPAIAALLMALGPGTRGTGPVRASEALAPTAQTCIAPLALTLHPGLDEPNNHVHVVASPKTPPNPVTIHVPIYAGARPSKQPMPQAAYGYSASFYLKGAAEEFSLPVGWIAARRWYTSAFKACGFTLSGTDKSGNRRGIVSIGLDFADPSISQLHVAVAFERAPDGGSVVLYVATQIALPPSPTLVPGTPTQVHIAKYLSLAAGQLAARNPSRTVTAQDPATLAKLQHHLNTLPEPSGVMSCPNDDGSHDVLRFTYAQAKPVRVIVGLRGCRIVRAGPLTADALQDQALFDLLARLLSGPGSLNLG